jgi:two-component system, NtrC family, nitrogen regulation response regulator GlnG
MNHGSKTDLEDSSLEDVVRYKLSQFMENFGSYDVNDLYPVILAQVEKPLIELTLRRSRGNQLKAAQILGINRNTLRKKIQTLGISLPPRSNKFFSS